MSFRILALALALLAAACAEARDPFDRQMSFARIERAFTDAGLHTCSVDSSNQHANQAVASRQYRLAFDCSTDDDAAVVVDQFKAAEDRDAAARGFEVQARPRAGGAVYTLGPFAVLAKGATTNDNVLKRVNTALEKLSAD